MTDGSSIVGAFKDPAGFVIRRNGRLLRQINVAGQAHYDALMRSGLYASLSADALLVSHEEVHGELEESPGAYRIIAPREIPFISYPDEWTFGQLKAAALLTLAVQHRALQHGMTLRDASARNVQFVGAKPIFIDTLSFGVYRDGEPWAPYKQFCEHFLGPLTLMARRDVRLNTLRTAFQNSIPLDLCCKILRPFDDVRMGTLLHLRFHERTQRHAMRYAADARQQPQLNRRALERLLDSLQESIEALEWNPNRTAWAEYDRCHGYTPEARTEKLSAVAEFLDRERPAVILDIGANVGTFSRLAGERGTRVVALDSDYGASELHYRSLQGHDTLAVTPVVSDITEMSSGGWLGQEYRPILDRVRADAVLALAVVHHLALGYSIPLDEVAKLLASAGRSVFVEFVPPDDPRVRSLIATKSGPTHPYTQEVFEHACSRYFNIVQRRANNGRILYTLLRV
jgi:SAM-dependent methyltransferase